MAIILKGLSGNVTVTVGGSPVIFYDYGNPVGVDTQSFSAQARNTKVLSDPNNPDSVTIVSQPSRGHVAARPDGKISLNLNDEGATTDLTFVYDRTVGATTTRVTATVTVSAATKYGWGIGEWFGLEVDTSTDRLVVEPGENAWRVHIASDGYTPETIAANEIGYSGVNAEDVDYNWLLANKAQGGDFYYGETEALALNKTLGEAMAGIIDQYYTDNVLHLLYKKGDVYASAMGVTNRGSGENRLHPKLFGSYGAGDFPYFQGSGIQSGTYYHDVLWQDIGWGYDGEFRIGTFFGVDGIYADMAHVDDNDNRKPLNVDGVNHVFDSVTIRRLVTMNAVRQDAFDGLNWSLATTDANSGFFSDKCRGLKMEKILAYHNGWEDGYRADRDAGFPKATEDRSHGTYLQTTQNDITIDGFLALENGHSAIQFRPSGVLMNVFAAGNNTGVNPSSALVNSTYGDFGNHGLIYRYGQTDGGFKDVWDGLNVIAGGIVVDHPSISIVDSFVMNAGTYDVYSSSTDIGPKVKTGVTSSSFFPLRVDNGNTPIRDELIRSNWNRASYADANVGGVLEATRDALTIGDHTDTWLSASGSDLTDYSAALIAETESNRWSQIKETLDYFLDPFGKAYSTRAVAQTVTFQPDAAGGTPGIRADIPLDWDTGDLPGHVAGDSIDLAGHHPYWNMTPANWIDDLTFGNFGGLTMLGGALKPQGTVNVAVGGNTLNVWNGSKFHLPAHADTNLLTVNVREGRFRNDGAMTGKINLSAQYGSEILFGFSGTDWTTVSGTIITLSGKSKAGFDGTGAATSILTISSGSTLRFAPSVFFNVDGLTLGSGTNLVSAPIAPRVGAIVTGLTSGATGIVTSAIRTGNGAMNLELEGLTGVFLNGESLRADCWFGHAYYGDDTTFGAVNGSPVHTMAKIREFACGVNGYKVAPDVVSTVVLESGSTVEIDTTGLSGPYDLIDVDSLTDNGATLPSGVTKVGNKLQLTVS